MGTVYRMTLQQLTGRWRLGIMTALAAMPVIITAVLLRFVVREGPGTADEYVKSFHDGHPMRVRTGVGSFLAAPAVERGQ